MKRLKVVGEAEIFDDDPCASSLYESLGKLIQKTTIFPTIAEILLMANGMKKSEYCATAFSFSLSVLHLF